MWSGMTTRSLAVSAGLRTCRLLSRGMSGSPAGSNSVCASALPPPWMGRALGDKGRGALPPEPPGSADGALPPELPGSADGALPPASEGGAQPS